MTRALVPEDLGRNGHAIRERVVASLVRAALCIARGVDGGPPAAARLLAKSWANDTASSYLVRAASSLATLTSTTALTRTIVADASACAGRSAMKKPREAGSRPRAAFWWCGA